LNVPYPDFLSAAHDRLVLIGGEAAGLRQRDAWAAGLPFDIAFRIRCEDKSVISLPSLDRVLLMAKAIAYADPGDKLMSLAADAVNPK